MTKLSVLVGLLSATIIDTTYAKKFTVESLTRQALSDPKSIGGIHTAAFENLSEKYAAKMESSAGLETALVSADTALQDMTEVMYGFCRDGDTKCMSNADDAMAMAVETIMGGNPGEIAIEYPADMDDSLTVLLDQMFDTVLQLDEDNLDTVLASLTDIQTQLEEVEGVSNPFNHYLARAASSVAIESSQLWHSVYTNPDHPLHPLVLASDDTNAEIGTDSSASEEAGGGRKLQLIQIGLIVSADVAGALIPIAGSIIPVVLTFLPVLIPILGLLYLPIAVIIFIFGSILTLLLSAFTAIAFSTVGVILSIPITIVQIFLDVIAGDSDSGNSTDRTPSGGAVP